MHPRDTVVDVRLNHRAIIKRAAYLYMNYDTLAERMEMDRATLMRYLGNVDSPTVIVLARFCYHLGMTFDEMLMGGVKAKEPAA